MNFVDKKDVALGEIRQKRRQVAGLFDRWAGGDADVHAHLVGDDAGQRGLAQSRRTVEQDMIQRLIAPPRRLNVDRQVLLDLFLSVIFAQALRPEGKLALILGRKARCYDGRFKIL